MRPESDHTPELAPFPPILIVEDDEAICFALRALLDFSGIQACWATNGNEALRFVRDPRAAFRIGIVDGRLPDMNGLDLIREMRASSRWNAPVYLCSADAGLAQLWSHNRLQGAVEGLIRKPFDLDEFIELIQSHLKHDRDANQPDGFVQNAAGY